MNVRGFLIQVALWATLAVATPAVAQTYEDGLVAFDKGDFATAAAYWQPLADGGNAKAQHGLGMLYEAGLGVPAQDYERAASYYRMAAAQGEVASSNNLALMYAAGRGVPQDFGQAAQLWASAAEAGSSMAQFNLGLLYFRGSGMDAPNYNEAAWWFGKAAENGSIDGQFAMGELFAQGLGVPQNLAEAERWYKLAAGGGQQAARQRLLEIQSGTFPPATGDEIPGPEGMMLPQVAPDTVVAEDASESVVIDEATGEAVVVETDEEEIVAESEPVEIVEETEVEVEEVVTRESVELPSDTPIAAAPTGVTYAPAPSASDVGATQTAAATVEPVASDPMADVAIVQWPETAPAAAPVTEVTTAPISEVATAPASEVSTEPATEVTSSEVTTTEVTTVDVTNAPIVNTVTAPAPEADTGSGIYLLLGQSISTEDGLRTWSELQRDHPEQLGALSSKLVPRGDGSLLILGGPLPSPDAGNRICMSLAQRDMSVECYVISN